MPQLLEYFIAVEQRPVLSLRGSALQLRLQLPETCFALFLLMLTVMVSDTT